MTSLDGTVVIVGAGHAGGSVATMLRQQGWLGPVVLLGEEPLAPYQRPPLSKAWLKGEAALDGLLLRKPEIYAQQRIDLRVDTRVVAINRRACEVVLADGGRLRYDALILATGTRPRVLPVVGADLPGVLSLRGLADADRLKLTLGTATRLAVVGGGYIGLEVASAARSLGLEVTVVEREERPLARVASPEISAFFRRLHEERGVAFALSAEVAAIGGRGGRVAAVELGDGRRIDADLVLVGIGAVADMALAIDAGLDCRDGVLVDQACRTSDPSIHAIGDITRRPLPLYGREGRLENVQNALEQARQTACDLCGKPPPAPEVPWFWSDQYETKLQIAGLPFGAVRRVVRGNPAEGRFAVFHLMEDGVLVAVEAVNLPGEFMIGRQWIGQRRVLSPERVADAALSIKEVAG
ncbi:3-phenylpropionate/trans-cinnamate dioxygenase ferredoxin reductase subunit [Azospirillum lipoferum]|nr:3-phenylpropionate/trans-cinnamate dioxygenase ferredoxin reductase subunit [Azospirillum lipoferum]